MYIAGKLANIKEQLEDRKNRNVKCVELHTNPWEFENGLYLDAYKELTENFEIISVHAPMKNLYSNECGVGYLGMVSKEEANHNMDIIKCSIKLANEIIKMKPKVVVVHLPEILNNEGVDINLQKEQIKKDIIELGNYAMSISKDIIIAIENNIRMVLYKGEIREVLYGLGKDVIDIISEIDLPNVEITLDICHALGSIDYNKHMGDTNLNSIEEYITAYAPKLAHVHVSNALNYGIGKGHGTPYKDTEEDKKTLGIIFDTLEKISYKGNIIIETLEEDVNVAENYTETMETIEKIK